jgi:hypothetical protein
MRLGKLGAVAIASVFFCVAANAQIPTSGNVFFGYSYFNRGGLSSNLSIGLPSETSRDNMNGWEASAEGKILPFIGMVADFSEHYGANNCPIPVLVPVGTGPSSFPCSGLISHEQNFLFGPRVSISVSKIRPFAEALFGAGHASTNGFGSNTSFATAIGGGLDYKIIRPLAWRFQGDYVQTRFFGSTQSNVRLSTGIVLRF